MQGEKLSTCNELIISYFFLDPTFCARGTLGQLAPTCTVHVLRSTDTASSGPPSGGSNSNGCDKLECAGNGKGDATAYMNAAGGASSIYYESDQSIQNNTGVGDSGKGKTTSEATGG